MDLNINLNSFGSTVDDTPARPPFIEKETGVWHFCIDNSTLEKFMACPKSAEYYVMRRRESPPSPALAFGGAIHEGLEALYLNGNNSVGQKLAREAFMQSLTERPVAGGDWRTADFGLDVLERYFKHYKADELFSSLYTHNTEPFVERSFTIELGVIQPGGVCEFPNYTRADLLGPDCVNPDGPCHWTKIIVFYTGKVDLAVRKGGHLWVMDHKTTTVLGQSFWDQFEMSAQTLGYTWAFTKITGETPAGALINCLALRKPTPTGRPIRFERQSFFYHPSKVQEWQTDTMTLVADFLSHAMRGYFPRTRLWCIGKYGKCRYHDVCTAFPDSRKSILNSNQFSNVTWDPTA